jgi:hypothetical protein
MSKLMGLAGLLSAVASFLPLVETNRWWVRLLDCQRLHYLVALLAIGAA